MQKYSNKSENVAELEKLYMVLLKKISTKL